jgi:hypothetical protein
VFIAFFVRARSRCFSIDCVLAVTSLLDEVVIASEIVLGGDAEVVLGGDAGGDGGDDMALTDTDRLESALMEAVQS